MESKYIITRKTKDDKVCLGILKDSDSRNYKYVLGKFENGQLVPGYAEFYDEEKNLLLAGVTDAKEEINGYGIILEDNMFYEGFFKKSKTLNSGIEFLNFNSTDPKKPKTLTMFCHVNNYQGKTSGGNLVETTKLRNIIDEFTKLQNDGLLQTDEMFERREKLFFERKEEFFKIFHDTFSYHLSETIKQYIGKNDIKPNPVKIEERKMITLNIKTQTELESLIEKKFEDLIGLDDVKEQLKNIFALKVLQGEYYKLSDMNMAFIGNPGTGKSTVANIVTELLFEMGVIKENKCVNVSFKNLYGAYVGHSLKAINEKLEEAKGGVFFLDEAHQLSMKQPGNDNFSKEIINSLITSIENNRMDTVFIFAGYKKEMKDMIKNVDKGFSSRIGRIVNFNDFEIEDLTIIFTRMLGEEKNYKGKPFTIDDSAVFTVYHLIESIKNQQGSAFGNARDIRILVRKVLEGYARTTKDRNNTTLTNDDFDKIFNGKIKIYEDKEQNGREMN